MWRCGEGAEVKERDRERRDESRKIKTRINAQGDCVRPGEDFNSTVSKSSSNYT